MRAWRPTNVRVSGAHSSHVERIGLQRRSADTRRYQAVDTVRRATTHLPEAGGHVHPHVFGGDIGPPTAAGLTPARRRLDLLGWLLIECPRRDYKTAEKTLNVLTDLR